MEFTLVVLAVLGCLLILVLVAERLTILWRTLSPGRQANPLEAEFVELKAYTHQSVHDLRSILHAIQLKAAETGAADNGRFSRLEAKTDAQTENLDRLLKIAETQLFKPLPSGTSKAE